MAKTQSSPGILTNTTTFTSLSRNRTQQIHDRWETFTGFDLINSVQPHPILIQPWEHLNTHTTQFTCVSQHMITNLNSQQDCSPHTLAIQRLQIWQICRKDKTENKQTKKKPHWEMIYIQYYKDFSTEWICHSQHGRVGGTDPIITLIVSWSCSSWYCLTHYTTQTFQYCIFFSST